MIKFINMFFSFKGCMTRTEYWLALIPILIVANILGYYIGYDDLALETKNSIGLFICLIISILLILSKTFIVAKRLADIGIPKAWSIITIIPLIGDVLSLLVGLIPSKKLVR